MFKGMTTNQIRANLVAKLQQNIENTDAMKPMIQEVDAHYPEVWEELVLEKKPKEQWDDDYFIELTTSFLMTCSKDTLLHAMEVGDVIAARREKRRAERERKEQLQIESHNDQKQPFDPGNNKALWEEANERMDSIFREYENKEAAREYLSKQRKIIGKELENIFSKKRPISMRMWFFKDKKGIQKEVKETLERLQSNLKNLYGD